MLASSVRLHRVKDIIRAPGFICQSDPNWCRWYC